MVGGIRKVVSICALIGLLGCGSGSVDKPTHVEPDWVLEAGLCDPETIIPFPGTPDLIVSNICAFKKNGEGYLSIITRDGRMKTRNWISGLNAPAGMAVRDGYLFVTDFDRVQVIELARGEIVRTLIPDQAVGALNDIAVDPQGRVYVSDSGKSRIFGFQTDGRSFQPFGAALFNLANGLHIQDDRLFVGGEKLWEVDLNSLQIEDWNIQGLSDIDGIEGDGQGGLVVSIVGGDVIHLPQNAEPGYWTTTDLSSTNHYFDPSSRQVFMPTGYDNTVIAFTLGALHQKLEPH